LIKLAEAKKGFMLLPQALGRRAQLQMGGMLSPAE